MPSLLERLQSFVSELVEEPADPKQALTPRVAVATLMVRVMQADGRELPEEREAIETLLAQSYGLDQAGVRGLLSEGTHLSEEGPDLYAPTALLRQNLAMEDRIALVGLLFEIAYADGELHADEDNLLKSIADRMGVDQRDRVLARRDVAERVGGNVIATSDD